MAWEFGTDPEFQRELDWLDAFVRDELEPLDFVVANPYDLANPIRAELIPPLEKKVQLRGLWACHLGPDLGGPGYGQVKLGLMNEIFGRARCAPITFGCQAPDSGNSEILAHYGNADQKQRFLEPLLRNEIVSCFSMTEPQGGAVPAHVDDPGPREHARHQDLAQRRSRLGAERSRRAHPPRHAHNRESFHMGLADGPTEVHKVTVARGVLEGYKATDGLFPTGHIPTLRERALARYADVIERHVGDL